MVGRMKYLSKDAKKATDDEKQDLSIQVKLDRWMRESSYLCVCVCGLQSIVLKRFDQLLRRCEFSCMYVCVCAARHNAEEMLSAPVCPDA